MKLNNSCKSQFPIKRQYLALRIFLPPEQVSSRFWTSNTYHSNKKRMSGGVWLSGLCFLKPSLIMVASHYPYKLNVDRNVLDSLTGLNNRQEQAMFNCLSKYKKQLSSLLRRSKIKQIQTFGVAKQQECMSSCLCDPETITFVCIIV